MKKLQLIVFVALFLTLFLALAGARPCAAQAQDLGDSTKMHVVVKHDGVEFIGRIISQDAREVLIETRAVGQVIIPKHEIREIREIKSSDFSPTGVYIPNEVFSTRYFVSTNGLPIEKGESYVQWNFWGPDFQFGVAKNFGMGIMTTWVACPIIVSAKYSMKLSKSTSLGVGTLLGTGSWTRPDFGLAVPFTALTFGDRKANITFSGGYGAITYKSKEYDGSSMYPKEVKHNQHRFLFSTAFMFKVGRKVSFVFDTFIVAKGKSYYGTETRGYMDPNTGIYSAREVRVLKERPAFALVIPGLRWQMNPKGAFQFGFTGLKASGEWLPTPIPMVQWYRKI